MGARALVRWITIEALGDPASGKLYRWATGHVLGDTDGVYRPQMLPIAQPIESRVDFTAQGGSRATIGGVGFSLAAGERDGTCVFFGASAAPARIAYLDSPLSSSDTTITLAQASGLGSLVTYESGAWRVVCIERECVRLTSVVSNTGDTYTYNCTRGAYGTTATAHGAGELDDTSVFPASLFHLPQLRVVTYGHTPPSGGYGDEMVLGRYLLREIAFPGAGQVVALTCDDALEAVRSRLLCGELWRARPVQSSALAGAWRVVFEATQDGADPSSRQDASSYPASDDERWMSLSLGGEVVCLTTWRRQAGGRSLTDAGQAGPWYWTSPGPSPISAEDAEGLEEVWEVFPVAPSPQTYPLTASATPTQASLSDNPVALARQILTTTQSATPGAGGPNGAYDLGIGQLGCAIPASLLVSSEWDGAEDETLQRVSGLILGADGEGAEALSLVQTLLAGAGWLMCARGGGLLGLARLRATAQGSELHLRQTGGSPSIRRIASQRRRLYDPVDKIVARWGVTPDGKTRQRSYSDAPTSRRLLGQASQRELDLSGVWREEEVDAAALREVRLWRWGLMEWELEVLLDAQVEQLRAGDTVLVSHAHLLAPTGSRGVSSAVAQVMSCTLDHTGEEGPVARLLLLHTGSLVTTARKIAPSALVDGVVGLVVSLDANAFSASLAPGQVDDTFGFAVEDEVEFLSRDRSTVRGSATVTAIGAASLTVDAVPVGVVAGDLVQPDRYAFCSAHQQETWAFFAASDGTVGGSDPGPEWTY